MIPLRPHVGKSSRNSFGVSYAGKARQVFETEEESERELKAKAEQDAQDALPWFVTGEDRGHMDLLESMGSSARSLESRQSTSSMDSKQRNFMAKKQEIAYLEKKLQEKDAIILGLHRNVQHLSRLMKAERNRNNSSRPSNTRSSIPSRIQQDQKTVTSNDQSKQQDQKTTTVMSNEQHLEEKVQELEGKLSKAKVDTGRLATEKKELEGKVRGLETTVNELTQRLQTLAGEIQHQRSENLQLTTINVKLREELDECNMRLADFSEKEKKWLEERRSAKDQHLHEAKKAQASLLHEAELNLADAKREQVKALEDLAVAKSKIVQLQKQSLELTTQLQAQQQNNNDHLQTLEASISELTHSNSMLDEQNQQLRVELSQLRVKLSLSDAAGVVQLDEFKQTASEPETQSLEALQREIDDLRRKMKIKTDAISFKDRQDQAAREILQERITSLESELADCHLRIKHLESRHHDSDH